MDNIPDQVWAYDPAINDFRLFPTEQEWKEYIDVPGAISYLKKNLQESLEADFYPAYAGYRPAWGGGPNKRGGGFFALLQIILPYITFLGTLSSGRESSETAIDYMNKYLSRINPKFGDRDLCQFIYVVFRHGLAHTIMPKTASKNGKVFGWKITFDVSQHLTVDKTPRINGKSALLSISPQKLADEVIYSIDEYIKDLQAQPTLFNKFKKGFLCMAAVSSKLTIPDCLKD